MEDKVKISVIIPVYNKEDYLKDCLDSIKKQSYSCFEVIIVDDGSTDHSGEICDTYAQQDNRFLVYHNQNQGVGASRNFGIGRAEGEYVTFVDADDTVHSDYLKSLLDASFNNTYDLIVGNYEVVTLDHIHHPSGLDVPSGTGNVYDDYYTLGFPLFTPWGKLYRTRILRAYHIEFPTNMRTAEDQVFNYRYYSHVDKYSYTNIPLYYYARGNENSLSSVKEMHTFCDELVNLRLKKEFCERYHVKNAGKILLEQIYFIIIRYQHMGIDSYNIEQYLWKDYRGSKLQESVKIYFIQKKQYKLLAQLNSLKNIFKRVFKKCRA